MKTLWIHGMNASPNEEKIATMRSHGLEVDALHLDYGSEPRSFEILRDHCIQNSIAFLVGSSYGGFLAFWLSEELGLPCLIINPAVSLRLREITRPKLTGLRSKLCIVALGNDDDKIDPERTQQFMDQDRRDGKTIVVKIWEMEGHNFSPNAFNEIIKWGLEELQKFKEANH
jgi:Predicted esterase